MSFRANSRTVYFVITQTLGDEPLNRLDADADIRYIHTKLGASMLSHAHGNSVLHWRAPADARTLVLPGRQSVKPTASG
jgi:hypothetical protein